MLNNQGNSNLMLPAELVKFIGDLKEVPGIYLVGGGVRDILLGRNLSDLDIALSDAGKLARVIGESISGTLVNLGENKGQICFRFVYTIENDMFKPAENENKLIRNRLWLDLVELNSGDVYRDLNCRDFTINAMALPLKLFYEYITGKCSLSRLRAEIIDPHGGLKDLQHRCLREVTPEIFKNDPSRLWRLWRIAAELKFNPSESLLELLLQDGYLCRSVPGERIRQELIALLNCPDSAIQLIEASKFGLVEHQFPIMRVLRKCFQGDYHYQDVWEHSFQVIIQLENLLNNSSTFFPDDKQRLLIEKWLESDTNRAILKLAGLLHDIGKPLVKKTYADGRVTFFNHEKAGLLMIKRTADQLRLSRRETALLLFLVKRHLQIHDLLAKAALRTKGRFWREHQEDSLGLVLLGIADLISKKNVFIVKEKIQTYLNHYVPEFIDIWLKRTEPPIDIKPLLNGWEIIEHFSLKSGPQIGYLTQALWDAQFEGNVASREEALEFIRMLISRADKVD